MRSISSVVTPTATASPAAIKISAAATPARRIAAISSGVRVSDDTDGPGLPVSA